MQVTATRMSIGRATTVVLPLKAAAVAPGSWTDQPDVGPAPRLDVPSAYASGFAASLASGAADAAAFGKASLDQLPRFAVDRIGSPPSGDVQKGELGELHRIADARTNEQVAASQWFSVDSLHGMWNPYLRDYEKRVGVDQAKAGFALLDRVMNLTDQTTTRAKDHYARKRPFIVDPTLKVPINLPGNYSYPSGHSSLAFAEALVLSSFMPDRKAEMLDLATQVAYSRVVGSVHFPSDVMAGARLAALVAGAVLSRR